MVVRINCLSPQQELKVMLFWSLCSVLMLIVLEVMRSTLIGPQRPFCNKDMKAMQDNLLYHHKLDLFTLALGWRHNELDGVSDHQPHDCLLNCLFRRRSKKTSKLRITGLCAGNSPGTGEFSAQMASNAENVSIWWRQKAPSVCVTFQWLNTRLWVTPVLMHSSYTQPCAKPLI